MEDFCDGELFSKHPLYSVHQNALQIFFYFDEVEYCNPLGSKTKTHKLGNIACIYVIAMKALLTCILQECFILQLEIYLPCIDHSLQIFTL